MRKGVKYKLFLLEISYPIKWHYMALAMATSGGDVTKPIAHNSGVRVIGACSHLRTCSMREVPVA
jgi:hypothetical protein